MAINYTPWLTSDGEGSEYYGWHQWKYYSICRDGLEEWNIPDGAKVRLCISRDKPRGEHQESKLHHMDGVSPQIAAIVIGTYGYELDDCECCAAASCANEPVYWWPEVWIEHD